MPKTRICVRIDLELARALKVKAIYEGRSASSIVEDALRRYLGEERPMSTLRTEPRTETREAKALSLSTTTDNGEPDWLVGNPWVDVIRRKGGQK